MFKRLFWLVTGAGFGFGMSLWVQRGLKRTASRYAPQRVSTEVTRTLRAAVQEGRDAMRQREAALRGNGS